MPKPNVWHIPYKRNRFFTGREEVLTRLHSSFQADTRVALSHPLGISGLGGIGKTQTALEYAYRYGAEYDAVLWVRADSITSLTSSLVELAHVLKLPERDEQDQDGIVQAVLRWLRNNTGWLLIYDNIDDLSIAEPFLPNAGPGYLLFTTRARALGGLAQRLDVQKMEPDVGALLLLRRANLLAVQAALNMANPDDQSIAQVISQELDGLPLALDQAGAYIKEAPCLLRDYLSRYQTRRSDLLRVRGQFDRDYSDSVATTWSLSFEKVRQANPAATELLNLCAFLAPDAIPEEIISEGASHLGPVLYPVAAKPVHLDRSIAALLDYSLVGRGTDDATLSVHRLVQAVLKDMMSKQEQQIWAERAICAVNTVFPEIEAKESWQQSTRVLPHALVCLSLQEEWNMTFSEAVHLLSQTGNALWARSQYQQAETLHKRVLKLQKTLLGQVHLDIARSLTFLANVYADQGNYESADVLYQQALDLYEQAGRKTHLDTARVLNAWAECYRERAASSSDSMLYERADMLYQRALDLLNQIKDAPPLAFVTTVTNHVGMQVARGNLEVAEAQLLKAVSIFEQHLGFHHIYTGVIIGNLGALYCALDRSNEAESSLRRALTIFQDAGENRHPRTAQILSNLGDLYATQEKYEQAEPLYREAIEIYESAGAANHPHVELFLRNYALLLWRMKRFVEAHTSLTSAESLLIAREGVRMSDELLGKPLAAKQEQGAAFLLSCCEFKDQAKAQLEDLWKVYEEWRKRHDRPMLLHSQRELVPFLEAKQCTRKRSNEDHWWQGIAIRPEYYEISLGLGQSDLLRF